MSQILYLDAFSGISGDMTVAALLQLGVSFGDLQNVLASLQVPGLSIEQTTVDRQGIHAMKFDVSFTGDAHHHRHLSDVLRLIETGDMPEVVKVKASEAFFHLATSEAKIHGSTPDKVHFHEVAAWDSIADVVCASYGLWSLQVDQILVGPVNLGSGRLQAAHGIYPVPAPATLDLLANYIVYQEEPSMELTTPTGAAILRTYATSVAFLPPMRVEKIGYGAGSRNPARPNVLRALIGTTILKTTDKAHSP